MPRGKMEHRSFTLKLDGPPDDEGRFTGYAAVIGNVDQGNDVIEPGAFTKTLQENPTVPILWSHNIYEPIGMSTSMTEDGKGLKIEGQLDLNVQRASEVHSLMRLGAIKGLSIGYNVVKRSFKGAVRHLEEIKVGEFSPCVFPMNPLANIATVKDFYGYEQTEGVGCLLTMIRCGADFLVEEASEGDLDAVATMQTILTSLAGLLTSELEEVAEEATTDDGPEVIYIEDEWMRHSVALAIKSLEALLATEPPENGTRSKGAASPEAEPEVASTLLALAADFSRAA